MTFHPYSPDFSAPALKPTNQKTPLTVHLPMEQQFSLNMLTVFRLKDNYENKLTPIFVPQLEQQPCISSSTSKSKFQSLLAIGSEYFELSVDFLQFLMEQSKNTDPKVSCFDWMCLLLDFMTGITPCFDNIDLTEVKTDTIENIRPGNFIATYYNKGKSSYLIFAAYVLAISKTYGPIIVSRDNGQIIFCPLFTLLNLKTDKKLHLSLLYKIGSINLMDSDPNNNKLQSQ